MRILLIEDDHASAQAIELMLKSENHTVHTTDLGEEGIGLAKRNDYDLILLDLNLPDMSGFDVLRDIRSANITTPIIIESGTRNVDAKARALDGGADDYMTKPLEKDELLMRCAAVVRRAKGDVASTIITGNISLNLDSKTVLVNGYSIHLTEKEYQILELFSQRKGSTLTKEMILDHLYVGKLEPELKIIDVFVCRIRKKLAAANDGKHHIDTVWGRGYIMNDPVPATDSPLTAMPAE